MARTLWLLVHAASMLVSGFRHNHADPRELPSETSYYHESPKLLLFWPVDGEYRTVEQLKKNLDYAKASLGANCCDVFLAHYKGDASLFGEQWYQENVVGNLTSTGYKFKLMQEAYNKAQLAVPWQTKYDFVWGLDSDVDLTGTNLTKLFRMVKLSNFLVAGPTFIGAGVDQEYSGADLQDLTSSLPSSLLDVGEDAVVLESRASTYHFERPDPSCDYRQTDFVELTAPILTMAALPMIFNDCSRCIHEESDWGLDMVWCNFLASKSQQPSCGLIDATPVNHLDWKQALPSKAFFEANREVYTKYRRFWSHFETLSCVVVDPALLKLDQDVPGLAVALTTLGPQGSRLDMLR